MSENISLKLDKIIKLQEENNKILKEIEKELIDIKKSANNMDDHIDNIMDIYSYYKKPLEYIKGAFNFRALT